MDAEEQGHLPIPPYTLSLERNSRGFTWSVKLHGDNPDQLMGMMRQGIAVINQAILEIQEREARGEEAQG